MDEQILIDLDAARNNISKMMNLGQLSGQTTINRSGVELSITTASKVKIKSEFNKLKQDVISTLKAITNL